MVDAIFKVPNMKLQEVCESALALPRRSREKLAQELAESVMSEQDLDILYGRGKFKNPPGSERTEAEWNRLLEKAGFVVTRIMPTKVADSVIEAVPGAANRP